MTLEARERAKEVAAVGELKSQPAFKVTRLRERTLRQWLPSTTIFAPVRRDVFLKVLLVGRSKPI